MFYLKIWYRRLTMNETPTLHEEKSFDAHTDEDLAIVNTPSVDKSIDDAQFLSRASQVGETLVQIPTQPEKTPSKAQKIITSTVLGATIAVPAVVVGGALLNEFDESIKENQEQNQQWADEAAQQQYLQQQQMVEENKIVLDIPSSDNK